MSDGLGNEQPTCGGRLLANSVRLRQGDPGVGRGSGGGARFHFDRRPVQGAFGRVRIGGGGTLYYEYYALGSTTGLLRDGGLPGVRPKSARGHLDRSRVGGVAGVCQRILAFRIEFRPRPSVPWARLPNCRFDASTQVLAALKCLAFWQSSSAD